MLGWSEPRRIGRPGVVTSTVSAARRAVSSRAAQRRASLGERRLDGAPDRVGDGADPRPVVGRQARRCRAGRSVSRPFLPRTSSSSASRRRDILAGRDRGERLVAQRLEIAGQVGEVHVRPSWVGPGISEPSSVTDVEGSSSSRCGRPAGSGALGELDDPPEGGRVADREVGQDLAVDLDVGLLQAVDELAVGEAVLRAPRR